eukprot:TRINITY_DN13712_c1_g1_i1.p1 TRINITY_DN13712_c1_g1~~TRINITY_DN13712_c1_g1_i1.p1  ORF type:complete len:369 (+),score=31.50 TRINITY_DN13712_c1_g1_i1:40-1107(+)
MEASDVVYREVPGVYIITRDTFVTASSSTNSEDVVALDKGSVVVVSEIVRLFDEHRIRGRLQCPQGWVSLVNTSDGSRWAEHISPGSYVIVCDTSVTRSQSAESSDISVLNEGTLVTVCDVVYISAENRVRGRIDDPAGWISLQSNDGEDQWAKAVEKEDAEVRSALRQVGSKLEFRSLRRVMRRAYEHVDVAHRGATEVWRTPLSLFDTRAEREATSQSVPSWAVKFVRIAQGLAGEASRLHDLTDTYESQIKAALKTGRGLHRVNRFGERRWWRLVGCCASWQSSCRADIVNPAADTGAAKSAGIRGFADAASDRWQWPVMGRNAGRNLAMVERRGVCGWLPNGCCARELVRG